jgi:hypothetical protein
MDLQKTGYQSYLLRIWQNSPGSERRIMLQDVITNQHWHFVDLERLFEFLQTQTENFYLVHFSSSEKDRPPGAGEPGGDP